MTIVTMCGGQGSGKSSFAKIVYDHYSARDFKVKRIAFATPLYEIQNMAFEVMEKYAEYPAPEKDGDFLQAIGTAGRKNFSKHIWINAMKSFLLQTKKEGTDLVVIDDCRFENEFDFLKDLGSIMIYLSCPEEIRKQRAKSWRSNTLHESETGLNVYANTEGKFDYTFPTNILKPDACFTQIKWELDNRMGIRRDKQK